MEEEVVQINQGIRQGCGWSSTLFNIYTEDVIRTWKSSVAPDMPLYMNIKVNTLLFADDQIVIQINEDDLQKSIYLLDKISVDCNMKI